MLEGRRAASETHRPAKLKPHLLAVAGGAGQGVDLRLCLVCCGDATEGKPPLLLPHPHHGVPGRSARPGRHDHAAPSSRGDAARWRCPALHARLRSQLVWRD